MKINKTKAFSLGILFFICLSNIMIYIPTSTDNINQSLKTSAGEINIVTPENKTYIEPMSGYYPATYGFENDEDGSFPMGWIDDSTGTLSEVVVASEVAGHKKVLHYYSYSTHYSITKLDLSSPQTTGSIEYYVYKEGGPKGFEIQLRNSTGDYALRIGIDYNNDHKFIWRTSGSTAAEFGAGKFSLETWFHIRVDFDLMTNKFDIYLDGVKEVDQEDFFYEINSLQNIGFYETYYTGGSNWYLDALSCSWDLDYSIGDNLHEGLLLGYENSTSLDWQGYSLDGNANKTISGNTTIPMPSFGSHSVQVFGNSTLGTMYHSNKVFFTTSNFPINILSPENTTYTRPMDGYYPATYGFENDIGGSDPSDFTVWEGGGAVLIRDSYMGHNKSVQLYDTSATDYVGIHDIFDSNQTTGTIEAFVSFTHTNKHHEFSIRDGSWSDSIAFSFIDGYLYYYTGGGWVYIMGSSFVANTWYHVKIEFNCSDAWHLWIDGIRFGNDHGFEFNGNPTEMDRVYFATHNSDANYNYLIDSIGYSWNENYQVGDNRREGLLLDYEINQDLVWSGYSLDNKANITNSGDRVIKMPTNGTHTLQVFGKNSIGDIFQSEKRHFTTHYKSVDVKTPENITYTAPMSGYFSGTYSFENDQIGESPEGWICSHTGTQYINAIEVINEKGNHKKVVELKDNDNSKYNLMQNIFPSKTKGTIEFWIASTDVHKHTEVVFRNSEWIDACVVGIKDGNLQFYYGLGAALTHQINDNQWYQVRVDFNCETSEGTYWVDQTLVGTRSLPKTTASIGMTTIYTGNSDSSYSVYLDAISYSWDPNYKVGDNHDEGILFSYNNISDIAWSEISLDDQPKQSISGNKTLPVPEDGMHSIQFFAQDNVGDYYESEKRYFTIEIAPSIEWISPVNGSTVILPYTKAPYADDGLFKFDYSDRLLDDVELEIDGTKLGSIWNNKSIVLTPYADYTNGFLSATLIGLNGGMIVDTDTRSFKFVKTTVEYTRILNSSTQIIGKQLYLILHDPHGDNSHSSISESTTLSMGVGSVITNSLGVSLEIGAEFSLFGVNAGASVLLEAKETLTQEYDFRYEITETTSLASSQVTNNADYIGPGYGDRYWGESWIYKWVLNATYREYSNSSMDGWEEPKLYYGILRGVETFASDEHAPEEWKSQNAVYNDTLPVSWITPFQESGGAPYVFENEVSTTTRRTTSIQIDLGADFMAKFGSLETHITIELSVKNYAEFETGNIHKVAYHIEDDDPSDFLVQWIGIDERFGTYIFEGDSFLCETSYPLEHNTYDYLPPEIDFPTITFDTNSDNTGPADDDSPFVRVNIFEEGVVQVAFINYSIDNGLNWSLISLSEILASPGIWEGTIPAQAQDTIVKWYVYALDTQGNRAERKDIYGDPFEYTVIAKPFVPSFPPVLIVVSLIIPVAAFLLRYRKKIHIIKA
ncbi:MAG: hypothetical protein ACTSYF_14090 [Promethearchaeota archaeon]